MKKRYVPILFLVLTLVILIPFVSAQTYSGFNKFIDNVKLFFSSGDNKVRLALEIREKELSSAMYNAKLENDEGVVKNLESAIKKLKIVQERVSPDIAEEVKNNIDEVKDSVEGNTEIDLEYFDEYLTEEEKTKLFADLSEKVFNYCDELATQDYDLMLEDEKCLAYSWMEDKVGKRIEEKKGEDFKKIKEQISICLRNPKECDCEEVSLPSEKANCEKYKTLAIKCEFQNDGSACKEIDKIEDVEESKRENYEKEILERYVPGECLEAGVRDGEECKKLIIVLNKPKSECMDNGQVLSEDECEKKLVKEDKIPEDCIQNGQAISSEECLSILKEKSKPSGEEFELMSGECKKRGVYDPVACDEIINLPRPCKDAGYYTKKECEFFTLKQSLPQECVEAGALTPEACEKLKLPQKCQGEAFSREDCEVIFIKEKMPPECQESETYNFYKCAKLLYEKVSSISIESEIDYLESKGISIGEIPDECLNGMNFVRGMACDEALIKEFGIMLPPPVETSGIPQECIRSGTPVSPEECEEILRGGIIQDAIPKVCKEAEVSTPEECAELLEQQRQEQGIGINMPEECIGISAEECKTIMEKKGIKVEKIEQVQKVEKVQKVCKEGEDCEVCCKIAAVVPEPIPKYEWKEKSECKAREGFVGVDYEVVSDEYCGGKEEIECELDFDCPTIMCITAPCPQYSCVDGECIIGREEEAECKSDDDCPTIMCEMPPCPQYSCINNKCATEYEEVTIPKECIELGLSDYESCKIAMSKINEERIKQGDEIIVDKEGKVDYVTNDQIKKIVDDSEKKSQKIIPNIVEAEKIKDEIEVIEGDIKEIEEKSIADELELSEEIKEVEGGDGNEVENEISNEVSSGGSSNGNSETSESSGSSESPGGDSESSGGEDSGVGDSSITGGVIETSNKESFLGKILKGIFGI